MMNFSVLPPEINSALMFSGAGSGPLLAAAVAWDGLASELDSAAESFSSVTSGLAAQAWQGPASQAMVAAAVPYAGWLSAAAAQSSGAAAQAQSVASAFESALVATVHPAAVAANRSDLVSLVMSNLFGQNAPAIAATESQYEEMWAQDVSAMVGYHGGASAAAAQLTTPAQAVQNLQNFGFGNIGSGNFGLFNTGTLNFGIGNTGTLNFGIGNFSPNNDTLNFGIGNTGTLNFGIGNTGNNNDGLFNFGSFDTGIGNTGSNLVGIGLTGNNKVGIGLLAISG
jgi:PPE-repeat protein